MRRRKIDSTQDGERELLQCIDSAVVQQARNHVQAGSRLDQIFSQIQHAQSVNTGQHQKTQKIIEDVSKNAIDQHSLEQFRDSLSFEYIGSRQQLNDAYPDTCTWIWKTSEGDHQKLPWYDFPLWLECGNGIYWIQGKPGSGKSTLMNYVSEHEELHARLATWTDGRPYVTAVFFFWRLGSSEQKSIQGLLRSLLLQILEKGPAHLTARLVSFVRMQGRDGQQGGQHRVRWSIKLLLETLWAAIYELEGLWSLCFLIDGLDEFEGEPEDQQRLIELLVSLSQNQNVKICLSSRPERHFLQAFPNHSQLKLQDFNHRDIFRYVKGTLGKEPHMQSLSETDTWSTKILLDKLSNKAEGVFLWAYFAVAQVLKGLWAMENFDDLGMRIDRLSKSLHGLFRQMLSGLEANHLDDLARILEIIKCWKSFQLATSDSSSNPSMLIVALALGKGAFSNVQNTLMKNDSVELAQILEKWQEELPSFTDAIKARGCGFLDISEAKLGWMEQLDTDYERPNLFARVLTRPHTSIQLIHRSILDFLITDDDAYRTLGIRMPQGENLNATLFTVGILTTDTSSKGDLIATYFSLLTQHEQINGALYCTISNLFSAYVNNYSSSNAKFNFVLVRHYLSNFTEILEKAQSRRRISEALWLAVDLVDNCISRIDESGVCVWNSPVQQLPYISDRLGGELAPASLFTIYSCTKGIYGVAMRMLPRFSIPERQSIASTTLATLVSGCSLLRPTNYTNFDRTFVCLLISGANCNLPLSGHGGRTSWKLCLSEMIDALISGSQTLLPHSAFFIKMCLAAGVDLSTVFSFRGNFQNDWTLRFDVSARAVLEHFTPVAYKQIFARTLSSIRWHDEPLVCKLRGIREGGPWRPPVRTWIDGGSMTSLEHARFFSLLVDLIRLSSTEFFREQNGEKFLNEFFGCMIQKYPHGVPLPKPEPNELGLDPGIAQSSSTENAAPSD